jgi:hypothetical protein
VVVNTYWLRKKHSFEGLAQADGPSRAKSQQTFMRAIQKSVFGVANLPTFPHSGKL